MYEQEMAQPNSNKKEELAGKLAEILGSTIALKYQAQGFHWNVRGPHFPQFHLFFGDIYESIEEYEDGLAENIRKVGFDAPFSIGDFLALSCLDIRDAAYDNPVELSNSLRDSVRRIMDKAGYAFKMADHSNEQGIADFLGGFIDTLGKWEWQLRSTIDADATQVKIVEIGD